MIAIYELNAGGRVGRPWRREVRATGPRLVVRR